jgi:hypothetical protein
VSDHKGTAMQKRRKKAERVEGEEKQSDGE